MCGRVVRIVDHHRYKRQSTYIVYCIHILNFKELPTWYGHLDPPTSIHYISYIYAGQCVILNFSVSKSKYYLLNYYNVLFTQLYRCFVFRIFFTTVPRFRTFLTQILFAGVINYNLAFYTNIFNLKNNTSFKI